MCLLLLPQPFGRPGPDAINKELADFGGARARETLQAPRPPLEGGEGGHQDRTAQVLPQVGCADFGLED